LIATCSGRFVFWEYELRWIKHLTAAASDEKLSAVISEIGLEGYGLFWRILEVIASQINGEEQKDCCTYPEDVWAKTLWISRKKFRNMLKTLENHKLFLVSESEKNVKQITIKCPNILKYRDEYSRKQHKKSG